MFSFLVSNPPKINLNISNNFKNSHTVFLVCHVSKICAVAWLFFVVHAIFFSKASPQN